MINRRQQGDLGEASALEWLTRQGASVFVPFGHSPDYDLIAEVEGRLLRIQVKTSTYVERTLNGNPRWQVQIATNGGNQSWSGVAKRFDPSRFDLLFVLTGGGRRWLVPAAYIEAETNLSLGGPKYSEFEIECTSGIRELVYAEEPPLKSDTRTGEYPRGQRTATVNRQAQPSQVRLLPPPLSSTDSDSPGSPAPRFQPSKYERRLGKSGQAVINQKRRLTLPQQALAFAGLRDGDRVQARADGPGRIVLEKVGLPVWAEPA
jgi:Holliday junction resolvase-like predicted endonuclease